MICHAKVGKGGIKAPGPMVIKHSDGVSLAGSKWPGFTCLRGICLLGNFFMLFVVKINFLDKNEEYHQSVNKFGSRSGPHVLSGLIWAQTVCKGY